MTLRRRKFTRSFKLMVLAQAETAKSIAEVAKTYEIAPQIVLRWRRELEANPDGAFTGQTKSGEERRIAELERKIGQLTMENDLLKRPYCGSRNNADCAALVPKTDLRADAGGIEPRERARHRGDVPGMEGKPGRVLPVARWGEGA